MANTWQQGSSAREPWDARSPGPDRPQSVSSRHHEHGHLLPVTQDVAEIEMFLSPFSGFGRMAQVQRHLASVQGVRSVRIGGLVERIARFVVTLEPGTSLEALVLANTVVVSASASKIELNCTSTVRARPLPGSGLSG